MVVKKKHEKKEPLKIVIPADLVGVKSKYKEEERPWTHTWRYVEVDGKTMEGYCQLEVDYNRKKSEFDFLFEGSLDNMKKVPNREYDPSVRQSPVPEFCQKKIGKTCVRHDCEFLAFCEPAKEEGEIGEVKKRHER